MIASAQNRRTWVVSELYYPEETSTGYFLTGIAQALAAGADVRVLCSQPTYSQRGVRAPWREQRGGVQIQRCRSTTLPRHNVLYRLLNLLTFCASVSLSALRQVRRGDTVLVVTNPPLLPFALALIARVRGARFVLLIHDVYPDVLVATGVFRPQSPLVRLLGRLSRSLYRSAERIVVIGRDMHELVARRAPDSASRAVVIPNWADVVTVRADRGDDAPLRERLGLHGRFVVQYMGNMGRTHGVEQLADVAAALRDQEGVHFMFVGEGHRKRWLREFVEREGLHNVSVLDSCPRAELSAYLNAADISVIAFRPGMVGVSVPSRMYNVLASGRPILAVTERHSELAQVVLEEQVGWVVPPGDAGALAAAIAEARRDPARLREMGMRARHAAETKYSYDVVAARFRDLLATAS